MATNLNPLPAWVGLDERKAARWPLDLPAVMNTPKDAIPTDVRIVDISKHGCLVADVPGATVGSFLTIKLPNGLAMEGWIAWSKEDHAGVDFAHPLLPGILAQLVLSKPPQG